MDVSEDEMGKSASKPRCSFCGWDREDPAMLIGGPSGVFICIECVDLCRQIFQEKGILEAGEGLNFSGRIYKDKRERK